MTDKAPVEVPDYDQVWDEVYGDLQDVGPVHQHMKRLMTQLVTPLEYDSVLEVGVGFGHNLPVLTGARKIERLAGIDISQRAVDHVSSQWQGEFHKLDIETERLPDTYEMTCISLVMEHVVDDLATLANLRAMTSKYLLVTTIGGNFERYRAWEVQMGHVRNYQRGELERKLSESGFEVMQMIYWGFPFYTPIARTLQNRMTATSEMSSGSQLIAKIMNAVYYLNSRKRGDLLVALARPV
jgi:hypothetical protein